MSTAKNAESPIGCIDNGTGGTDTIPASLCAKLSVGETVEALILDARPIAHDVFGSLPPDQRRSVAFEVWNVGLTALANAFTQSRESRLEEIGQKLRENLEEQLTGFVETQQQAMATSLSTYFDPQDGEFSRRLNEFISDDGELHRVLRDHLGSDGTLAQTLAQHIGENSTLLRRLSPTDGEGFVKALEKELSALLATERSDFLRTLDPLAPDGAAARFLRTLRDELRKTEDDRAKQLVALTAALDANNPQSLISRLLAQSQAASRALMQAINPDAPGSAMSTIKATIVGTLEAHFKTARDRTEAQERRQALFQQQMTETLSRIEGARERDERSPRGGFEFEDEVLLFIQRALGNGPYVCDKTATAVGLRKNCKTGDQVVRFTKESAFHGAALVVEAKRDAKYTLTMALEESALARENRGATAGLFVMAASHAPCGFPPFTRHGDDVVVVWDPDDPVSDAYLHAALLLGLCLASRRTRPEETGQIDALASLEGRLETERKRLESMKKWNERIRDSSDKIGEEIEKGLAQFKLLIRRGKETLAALNVTAVAFDEGQSLSFGGLTTPANDTNGVDQRGDAEAGSAGTAEAQNDHSGNDLFAAGGSTLFGTDDE